MIDTKSISRTDSVIRKVSEYLRWRLVVNLQAHVDDNHISNKLNIDIRRVRYALKCLFNQRAVSRLTLRGGRCVFRSNQTVIPNLWTQ